MDNFEKYLQANNNKQFFIITPGGNHGDSLIHMALIKKLQEYDIKYHYFNLETKYKHNPILASKYLINIALWKIGSNKSLKLLDIPKETEIILFEGGGYMNDIWYGPVLLKQALKQHTAPITVAPQSFLFDRTILKDYFKDNRQITLFCREHYSMNHLQGLALPDTVSIKLSPEMALYLTPKDLEPYIETRTNNFELISFRKDNESAVKTTTISKIISTSKNPLVEDISTRKTLTDYVSTIKNAKEIYTDRLHVAILSKIMSQKVTLFGNKYHKNKGVWEYSLTKDVIFEESK
jgi:exopolysaccharide biosynthesis predicted pyruvyltransferase EpsI